MQQHYYVYVLRSLKDKQFYVGFTKNLPARVEAHNDGAVPSTRSRIAHSKLVLNQTDATNEKSTSGLLGESDTQKQGSGTISWGQRCQDHDDLHTRFKSGQTRSGQPATDGDLIRVDGEPLLRLGRNEAGGLNLTLALYDPDDSLLVRIVDNEWISETDSAPWDLYANYQYLRIRQQKRDIRLEVDTKQHPIQLRATLWRKGQRIGISSQGLVFGEKETAVTYKNFIFRHIRFDPNTAAGPTTLTPEGAQPQT